MRSGAYDNPTEHADGRYELQRAGSRVVATFATTQSPVPYWAREVAAPLFTVPEGFRPPYPILRTAEGTPVLADGAPDPDHREPCRFLLRVDPDGAVHYADDSMDGVGHLAYSLDTVWGTTPAANDRAVLEILDRHWFRQTLLSAEPPPEQFEVPAHVWSFWDYQETRPAALVGAFVAFDEDGRVTALGAPTNEFKFGAGAPIYIFHGPLPAELGQLHRLERLDLEYRVSRKGPGVPDPRMMDYGQARERAGRLPPQLGQLARLRHLDLSGHVLIGTIPPELGRLASLEYLDLGNNELTGSLPPELGQFTNLQHLDLTGNQLTALPPELGQLANLRTLKLGPDNWNNGNRLTALPPELGQLHSLQHLDLTGNRLTALPPELGRLANLQHLDLTGNRLTALPPELGRLANLQHLDLTHNRLTTLPPELGRLPSLQHLDLSYNQLYTSPRVLGQLHSLQHLDLSSNWLTALPPELGQLPNLQMLRLENNRLPERRLPPEWSQLASLEYLDLADNQLTGPLPPEWGQLAAWQPGMAQPVRQPTDGAPAPRMGSARQSGTALSGWQPADGVPASGMGPTGQPAVAPAV